MSGSAKGSMSAGGGRGKSVVMAAGTSISSGGAKKSVGKDIFSAVCQDSIHFLYESLHRHTGISLGMDKNSNFKQYMKCRNRHLHKSSGIHSDHPLYRHLRSLNQSRLVAKCQTRLLIEF